MLSVGLGDMPPEVHLAGLPRFSAPSAPPGTAVSGSLALSVPGVPEPSALPDASVHMLPQKLVKRIRELEYVEMSELVQEAWQFHDEEQGSCCHAKRRRRNPVTDILIWVDCYASLVAVLSVDHPDKTPEFMAYMKTVVYASKSFSGDGWVTYDSCYRRKAAATKSLDWSRLDFNLYNQIFAGRAKALPRCRLCNSELHTTPECHLASEYPDKPIQGARTGMGGTLSYVCQLFNNRAGNRCRFQPCKFKHCCSECGGGHPISQCRGRMSSAKRYPRRESPQRNRK